MKLYRINLNHATVLSLIALPLIFATACKSKKETYTVQSKEIIESVYATATIKADMQYSAFAPISGIIRDVLVTEGQNVVEGQIIARIQNSALGYVSENAKVGLDQARSNYGNLDELKVQLSSARKQLSLDSVNLTRQRELWNQNIGTKNQLETRQLAYEVSKNNLSGLETRFRQTSKQIQNSINQAQNQVGSASANVSDLEIKSKITGTVYSINFKAGEMANPQLPVAIIGKSGNFYLELEVDETDVTKISEGQIVIVSLDAYPGKVFEAKISKISPNMNLKTQTFTVEAVFDNPPAKLFPGLSAEASIVLQKKPKTLVIPISYLIGDNKVLTEKGEVTINTGIKNLEFVEVLSGLSENAVIIKP